MTGPAGLAPRPFTVIGGFLGAGKTTLVNRILREASGTRYAVLVNDFGAVNVDAGLIARHDGQTMALTNGCICCSMSDGFTQAMLRLMADPAAFDHVIVEASGVAEPGRIMDFARLDPQLSPDAILVLVDAETLTARLADPRVGDVVGRQIATADLLLLNKTDLADEAGREAAAARLRGLNPRAPVLPCRAGELPLPALLGTGGAGGGRPGHDRHGHAGHGEDGHGEAPHRHDVQFRTALLRREQPVRRAAFEAWAAALPDSVLRGKGRLALAGEGAFTWQKVGRRETLVPVEAAPEGTELVLIAAGPGDLPALGE